MGHVRCTNARSASMLVRAGIKGCFVSMVEGMLLVCVLMCVCLCADECLCMYASDCVSVLTYLYWGDGLAQWLKR